MGIHPIPHRLATIEVRFGLRSRSQTVVHVEARLPDAVFRVGIVEGEALVVQSFADFEPLPLREPAHNESLLVHNPVIPVCEGMRDCLLRG